MIPAGKLDILISLLESGQLCKCNRLELVRYEDADGDSCWIEELRHDEKCEARVKAQSILQEIDDGI